MMATVANLCKREISWHLLVRLGCAVLFGFLVFFTHPYLSVLLMISLFVLPNFRHSSAMTQGFCDMLLCLYGGFWLGTVFRHLLLITLLYLRFTYNLNTVLSIADGRK